MTEMNEIIIDDEVLNGLVSSVPATAEGLDSVMEDIVYRRGGNRTNPYIVAKRTECPEFQFLRPCIIQYGLRRIRPLEAVL